LHENSIGFAKRLRHLNHHMKELTLKDKKRVAGLSNRLQNALKKTRSRRM
jgi:hypothetical protein